MPGNREPAALVIRHVLARRVVGLEYGIGHGRIIGLAPLRPSLLQTRRRAPGERHEKQSTGDDLGTIPDCYER
jgi:hypothetical protein